MSGLFVRVSDQYSGAVFHIDAKADNVLVITLTNETSETLIFRAREASRDQANIVLRFVNSPMYFYTKIQVKGESWILATDGEKGWVSEIYLAAVTDLGLPPTHSLKIFLSYQEAVPSSPSVLTTEFHISYRAIFTDSDRELRDEVKSHLALMANEGPPLPLLAGFVGRRTVVNDGVTSQVLRLRLVNTSADPMAFWVPIHGQQTQSCIEVRLPVSEQGLDAGDLCSRSQALDIHPRLSGTAHQGWVVAHDPEPGVFLLLPENSSLRGIPGGGTLDLILDNVKSAAPSGHVQVQVTVRRFALYGTQCIGVDLEKSPLSFQSPHAGMLLSAAGSEDDRPAFSIEGRSTKHPLLHIHQQGGGEGVRIVGGLTASGQVVCDTAYANFSHIEISRSNRSYTGVQSEDKGSDYKNRAKPTLFIGGAAQVFTGKGYGDAVVQSLDLNNRTLHDLIGIYPGWSGSTVFIAGYNHINSPDEYSTTEIAFGGWGQDRSPTMWVDLKKSRVGINACAPEATLHVGGAIWDEHGPILPRGLIMMWYGSKDDLPKGWALCDGKTDGVPDLSDRFIVGAGKSYKPGDQGGATHVELTVEEIPPHRHNIHHGWAEAGGSYWQNIMRAEPDNLDHWSEATGGGRAHENRPPYLALYYIMRL